MKVNVLAFLLVAFFAISCSQKPKGFELNGKLSKKASGWIFLDLLGEEARTTVDSVKITAEGYFKFKEKAETPGYYVVRLGNGKDKKEITLALYPGDNAFLYLNKQAPDKYYGIAGSPDSKRIQQLNNKIDATHARIKALGSIFYSNIRSPFIVRTKSKLDSIYKVVEKEHYEFTRRFIAEQPESFASLMALYQQLGPRIPVLKLPEDSALFRTVSTALNKKWAEAIPVKSLNSMLARWDEQNQRKSSLDKKLTVGQLAPEIVLPDTAGKPLALSSLRGKIVLLSFWASWNPASRADNPGLLKAYHWYHYRANGGFEIYQVSLDRTKEGWIKAINEDGLTWNHVSDLKMWQSAAVPLYGIEGLPHNFLLDRDGKILAKDLKPEELLLKLFQIFGPSPSKTIQQKNDAQ
jgi:peroxiredoxin